MIEHYELLYIIPGTKTDEEAKPLVEGIHQLMIKHGATMGKIDFWGKRKLAYEIDHIRQGFYDLIEFDIETEKLAAMEKDLRLNENVLRHQIVRRVVKSAAVIAREEALHQRIAAKRQAEKDRQSVATMTEQQTPVSTKVEDNGPVAPEQLDEKLKEILGSDKVEV
jgi:small subunit ribosomal protein S6